MPNYRQFIISDEVFSGFTVPIDLDYCDSLVDICHKVQNKLTNLLSGSGLIMLAESAAHLDLHIHDVPFADILLSEPDATFWACGHCRHT